MNRSPSPRRLWSCPYSLNISSKVSTNAVRTLHILSYSHLLFSLDVDESDETPVPLPNVNTKVLKKVNNDAVQFLVFRALFMLTRSFEKGHRVLRVSQERYCTTRARGHSKTHRRHWGMGSDVYWRWARIHIGNFTGKFYANFFCHNILLTLLP